MSIFITNLAFPDSPATINAAKIAILLASLTAGVVGMLWLGLFGKAQQKTRNNAMIENGFEVAPETSTNSIGTIYRSSDAFVSNFDENYPTIAELADHIVTLAKKPGNVLPRRLDRQEEAGFLHIEPRGPQ